MPNKELSSFRLTRTVWLWIWVVVVVVAAVVVVVAADACVAEINCQISCYENRFK